MDNNEEISDIKSIANAFNNYFSNIGKELDKQIPRGHCNPMDYLYSPVKDSFFLFPTTSREIEVEISSLRISKVVSPFSIHIDILKIIKCVVSKPLEMLFNASFSTGIVPYDLKLANLVPVYKKGSQVYQTIGLFLFYLSLIHYWKGLCIVMISGILFKYRRAHCSTVSQPCWNKTWILFTKLFYPDPSCN